MDFSSSACCVSTNLLTDSFILTETMIHNDSNIFLDSMILSSTVSLFSPSYLFDESHSVWTLDFDKSSKLIYTNSYSDSRMSEITKLFSGSDCCSKSISLQDSETNDISDRLKESYAFTHSIQFLSFSDDQMSNIFRITLLISPTNRDSI
jgi:hypothetical protein